MIKIIRATKKYKVVGLSSPGDALNEVSKREGIQTIAIPFERRISIKDDLVSLWKLIKIFRKEKPTMVHSMTPKAGLLCMVAAKLTGVPVRVHTFTGLVFPTSTGIKRRLPEGEGVKNDLLNNRITKKPLKVLGYGNVRGVDMSYYSRKPEVMKIAETLRDSSMYTFLFVGRIVRDKGVNELCKAFQRIHSLYPNTRLWLVGLFEDNLDPISNDSRKIIDDEKNGIMAVGRKSGEELLAYYAAADCFVLPSYREGFPNTVLEAGAMGLPSIVTDINGSREIIIEGQNGTIIPSKDEFALYDAMQNMINNPEWGGRMANKARDLIAKRFEQSYVRKCLYDFYDEILANR